MLLASSIQAMKYAEHREVMVLLVLTAVFLFLLIFFIVSYKTNPTEPLTEEDKNQIRSTGLIYFTDKNHLMELLLTGLSPADSDPAGKKKSGPLWLYLFTLDTLNQRFQHAQKDNPQCDSAILISDIPEPIIGTLRRSRKRPYLIALTEDLKTDQMVPIDLQ